MKRGEIWVARLDSTRGAEAGKARPVLVIEADFLLQQGEPTVIVLPLTSQVRKSKEPLHVTIPAREGLRVDSQVMPEHPRSLDRRRLVQGPLTTLRPAELAAVERSLLAVLGFYRLSNGLATCRRQEPPNHASVRCRPNEKGPHIAALHFVRICAC